MKIGIVTVHDSANFGSYLQAYGIKKIIEDYGHEAYFITTRNRILKLSVFCGFANAFSDGKLITLLKFIFFCLRNPKALIAGCKKMKIYEKDQKAFRCISYKSRMISELSLVLFGSDELWNVRKEAFKNPLLYGDGIKAKKKIAYAMSIGNMDVNEWDAYPYIKAAIKGFDAIYCRDARTISHFEKNGFKVDSFICDPTIQTDIRKYMHKKCEYYIPEDDYILIYSYNMQPYMIEYIKRFAAEHNLKTAAISLYHDWCDYFINCGPLDFGVALSKAKFVYTTTFHGSIFSTLYHTKFAVKPVSPKINDVLERLGTDCAIISEKPTYEEFSGALTQEKDYEAVEKNILALREEAHAIFRSITKQ